MDPLSLAASILAVLGAGGTIAKGLAKIRRLKRAPCILLQLNNEVTDLHLLIRAVNEIYHSSANIIPVSTLQEEVVYNALKRAKHDVLELEKLIEYILTKETSSGTEIDTLAWIRALDRVKEACDHIRASRNDLNIVWTTLSNRHVSTRLELQLQGVITTVADLHSNSLNVQGVLGQTADAISRQTNLSEIVQEETCRCLESIAQTEPDRATDASRTFSTTSSLGGIEYPRTRSEESPNLILKLTDIRKCERYCICSCHTQRQLQTPKALDHILGLLFTGYIGIPALCASCDVKTCRVRSPAKGYLFYMFPKWFVKMAILIKIKLSQVEGPEMLIRCLRVRSFSATPSFQALSLGQHDQLKSLLTIGKASMLDVDEGGRSLLHHSVLIFTRRPDYRDHFARCLEFLLRNDADPFQENQSMMSPYISLLTFSLKEPTTVNKYPFLELLLRRGDPTEMLNFSRLHSLVVDSDNMQSFHDHLTSISRNTVDWPDYTGRTALSWAAGLGKIEKIKMLLMKGADPNRSDFSGSTPLTHCILDMSCLTTMLEAGADVDHERPLGGTKFMDLVRYEDNVECAELLHRFGANIDYHTKAYALIHIVVDRYSPRILSWLLEQEVDIEAHSTRGETALLAFISTALGEDSEMLESILHKKPNYQAMNHYHEGLLHYIARFGKLKTLATFQEQADLSDLEVNQRSTSGLKRYETSGPGKTAIELAEWRRDYQTEWALDTQMNLDPDPQAYFVAFESFIELIRAAHIAKTNDRTRHDTDVFTQNIPPSGDGINSGESMDAGYELRLRIPGSFPRNDDGHT